MLDERRLEGHRPLQALRAVVEEGLDYYVLKYVSKYMNMVRDHHILAHAEMMYKYVSCCIYFLEEALPVLGVGQALVDAVGVGGILSGITYYSILAKQYTIIVSMITEKQTRICRKTILLVVGARLDAHLPVPEGVEHLRHRGPVCPLPLRRRLLRIVLLLLRRSLRCTCSSIAQHVLK